MKITQQDYDTIVFLTRLVYYDLNYPEPFKCIKQIEIYSGLKLNIFDMDEYELFVICGTNSLRDWITNLKVGLGITPAQYDQAYYYVKNNTPTSGKPIVICGHSLGGGIAEYVASQMYFHDTVCITLNGCGSKHLIHPVLREVETLNVITEHDILNNMTRFLPFKNYMKHTGKEVVVDDDYFFPLSIRSHCDFRNFTKYVIR